MKKLLMLSLGLLVFAKILGQGISDALLFSNDNIQGTARFKAMGGAFGALGGDMSAVNINPAGSVIFNSSSASVTLGYFGNQHDVGFGNSLVDNRNSDINVNQFGGVFVFKNYNEDSKWKKFALGVAYDTNSNFENNWIAQGSSSVGIDSYFLNRTNTLAIPLQTVELQGQFIEDAYIDIAGIPGNGYDIQQVFLGYQANIISPVDPLDPNGIDYVSNTVGDAIEPLYNQRFSYNARGFNSKFAFNFATSYNDRLYLGLNLNVHLLDYNRITAYNESNSNDNAAVRNLRFINDLRTTGAGFSAQLGAIGKITESLRLGVTYKTPTWFRINDELVQDINTNSPRDLDIGFISTIINVFPTYRIQTPGRIMGSLAYVFGKRGLISFDYSLSDFSTMQLRPSADFVDTNALISSQLDIAATYRLGVEYRIKQWRLRGGYRLEESPYKNDSQFGDLTVYSLGLGYDFGAFDVDFAFSQAQRDTNYQLFDISNINDARLESRFTNIIMTASFNL